MGILIHKPLNNMISCPYCGNEVEVIIKYKYDFKYPFTLFFCSECHKFLPTKQVKYVERG